MNKLQQYRAILRRLDPSVPIQSREQQAWYIERPDSIAQALARDMQLEPKNSHLIVGSIGCGKSTELLAAERILVGTQGVFARYVEVSTIIDIESATAASLAIAIADELVSFLSEGHTDNETIKDLKSRLDPFLHGGVDPYFDDQGDKEHPGSFGPVVQRPQPAIPEELNDCEDFLRGMAGLIAELYHGADFVWLLDGLDRLASSEDFDRIVIPLLQTLKAVGIGVVMVGPLRMISGLDRLGATEVYDLVHPMGPLETDIDTDGFYFLHKLLAARDPDGFVAKDLGPALIRDSGGVARILLQLARETIKQTYIDNKDQPGHAQLTAAVDKVGRALLLGLSDPELALLKALIKTGVFAPRTASDKALVPSNRVLEYRGAEGPVRHAVHPALVRFVNALPDPKAPEPTGQA